VIRHHFQLKETIATVLADSPEVITGACRGMEDARLSIERYIRQDPFFQTSFDPLPVDTSDPVIRIMARAADAARVGPMAAVAGTVAGAGVQAAIAGGAGFCVIDNGGDIALVSDRTVRVGLYAGTSPLSGAYAFVIDPRPGIYGICTSSATVGPSISLGTADSVTVFAPDPSLADAVATRVCNDLRVDDQSCLDEVPDGVDGIFAVFGGVSIISGIIPTLVPAPVDERLITTGFSCP
jgi:ApbE superfamily uncharacterized protein (UPF0280 family)